MILLQVYFNFGYLTTNIIYPIFLKGMIPKEKIKLCAENITKSVNIKKEGEFILIKGAVYSQELLEEIGLSVLRQVGVPHFTSVSDYYEE